MNPIENLKLIDGSILKWKQIVNLEICDDGPRNCPLCKKYWKIMECIGCPIHTKTEGACCKNTPYPDFCKIVYYHKNKVDWEMTPKNLYLKRANRMLSFLYEIRLWYLLNYVRKYQK